MRIEQKDITTKCPRCNGETDSFMYLGGLRVACNCSKCKEELRLKPMGKVHEWTTDEIKDGRKKYEKELLQPFREGQLSKEYADAYPEQTKGMVKEGILTEKQVRRAKNVWHGDNIR